MTINSQSIQSRGHSLIKLWMMVQDKFGLKGISSIHVKKGFSSGPVLKDISRPFIPYVFQVKILDVIISTLQVYNVLQKEL